jgi:hypothetical protein
MGYFNGSHLSHKEKHYSGKNGYCYPCSMSCATKLPIKTVLGSVRKRGVKIDKGNGMTDSAALRVLRELGYTFAWGYHPKAPMVVTVKVGDEYHAVCRNPDGTWCCNRSGHRMKSFQVLQRRLADWFREVDGLDASPDDVHLIQHISIWPTVDDGWELEVPDIDDFLDSKPKEYIDREDEDYPPVPKLDK